MNTETLSAAETTAAPSSPNNPAAQTPAPSLPPIHLKNILVPLDLSPMSLKSLQYAIPFAKHFGATLTLLYVVEPPGYLPDMRYGMPLPPEPSIEVEGELQRIRATMISTELSVQTLVRHDFPCDGVIEAARDLCADLIITTTHDRTGVSHLLMGSTAEKIVRRAPCPVLVLSGRDGDFL